MKIEHLSPFAGLAVSRDVHYVAPGSADGTFPKAHRAAKVTEIASKEHGIVNLIVFNPQGIHFPAGVTFDETGERPFSWHWPEQEG